MPFSLIVRIACRHMIGPFVCCHWIHFMIGYWLVWTKGENGFAIDSDEWQYHAKFFLTPFFVLVCICNYFRLRRFSCYFNFFGGVSISIRCLDFPFLFICFLHFSFYSIWFLSSFNLFQYNFLFEIMFFSKINHSFSYSINHQSKKNFSSLQEKCSLHSLERIQTSLNWMLKLAESIIAQFSWRDSVLKRGIKSRSIECNWCFLN